VSLREGLKKTVEFFRSQPERPPHADPHPVS
jgi:hypothetical protein